MKSNDCIVYILVNEGKTTNVAKLLARVTDQWNAYKLDDEERTQHKSLFQSRPFLT